MTALSGEAAIFIFFTLFIIVYKCNSPGTSSDFDRLIPGCRLTSPSSNRLIGGSPLYTYPMITRIYTPPIEYASGSFGSDTAMRALRKRGKQRIEEKKNVAKHKWRRNRNEGKRVQGFNRCVLRSAYSLGCPLTKVTSHSGMHQASPRVYPGIENGSFGHTRVCPRVPPEYTRVPLTGRSDHTRQYNRIPPEYTRVSRTGGRSYSSMHAGTS